MEERGASRIFVFRSTTTLWAHEASVQGISPTAPLGIEGVGPEIFSAEIGEFLGRKLSDGLLHHLHGLNIYHRDLNTSLMGFEGDHVATARSRIADDFVQIADSDKISRSQPCRYSGAHPPGRFRSSACTPHSAVTLEETTKKRRVEEGGSASVNGFVRKSNFALADFFYSVRSYVPAS